MQGYEQVGQGQAVFAGDGLVEAPTKWLDSPQAVMDFVATGAVDETVVVVRGGTTTFLAPVLAAGVKGILTLQGAPESHLGILSREYGIPCVMSVAFEKGVRTDRGETVPADGSRVRLDLSNAPAGIVWMDRDAETSDAGPEPPPAMDPEAAAQIELLLTRYGGQWPHGTEGDRAFRAGNTTRALYLDDDTLRRQLTVTEVNEVQRYKGWNLWDCLAARATEGESGLIPRQEYESVGFVECWQRYPRLLRLITEELGADGVIELGRVARREIGTKANMLHCWTTGFGVTFGRGVAIGLGLQDPGARHRDVNEAIQFMRRVYRGMWGDEGPAFCSMRDYRAPLLESDLIERFVAEAEAFEEVEQRQEFQRFNARTELMGFLLHFDNRVGLSDTGPYPLPDGRFMIVRDHFLYDDVYHWGDVARELPHAVTQAMIFDAAPELTTQLLDIGTLFTEPANYLQYLRGAAVYARDRWDTPMEELRIVDAAERARIVAACDEASTLLYARIASMPKRDKIMAGAQVYTTDFILPFARISGLWNRFRDEEDFFELDPMTSGAYYPLVKDGVAAQLVPQLFLTGTGFPLLEEVEPLPPDVFASLHRLMLRGILADFENAEDLVARGLVAGTPSGYLPTQQGAEAHAAHLAFERGSLDLDRLSVVYERFLAANAPFKRATARWSAAADDERFGLLDDIGALVASVVPALSRTAEIVPRFTSYAPRLEGSLARVEAGERDFVVSPSVDSLHNVWMDCHEDYLLTQGISREDEGSF